jgi:hypothetical protein
MGIGGGALQGAAVGGLPGAIIGGALGGLSTANNASAYDRLRTLYEKQQHENKKTPQNLGYYAQFGGETPEDVMSQTELGEVVLFPDNTLPNVKAREKHVKMGDEKVTDILPQGSYVFSDDKEMRFDVKDVKDKILGYGMSHYDEHTDYDTEEMLMGDFLPKKGKMTFAAAAKTLKSKIKTIGDKNDLLGTATDSDNLETRVPYLMELISLQDQKNTESGRVGSTVGGEGEMPEEFQFGTLRPPRSTSNPRDVQMYNDSLALHNQYAGYADRLHATGSYDEWGKLTDNIEATEIPSAAHIRLRIRNGVDPTPVGSIKKVFPSKTVYSPGNKHTTHYDGSVPQFAKPTQPYILKDAPHGPMLPREQAAPTPKPPRKKRPKPRVIPTPVAPVIKQQVAQYARMQDGQRVAMTEEEYQKALAAGNKVTTTKTGNVLDKDKFVLRKYGTPPAPPKFGSKWQIIE